MPLTGQEKEKLDQRIDEVIARYENQAGQSADLPGSSRRQRKAEDHPAPARSSSGKREREAATGDKYTNLRFDKEVKISSQLQSKSKQPAKKSQTEAVFLPFEDNTGDYLAQWEAREKERWTDISRRDLSDERKGVWDKIKSRVPEERREAAWAEVLSLVQEARAADPQSNKDKAAIEKDLQDPPFVPRNRPSHQAIFTENILSHFGEECLGVDDKGRIYAGPEAVAGFLSGKKDKELYIYPEGSVYPYALKKEGGKLMMSTDLVSTENRLPESAPYEPAPSLKIRDIAEFGGLYDMERESKLSEERKNQNARISKHEKYKETARKDAEKVVHARWEAEEGKKVDINVFYRKPKKPVKPSLSLGDKLVWGLKKLFTLGMGDTKANRLLIQRLAKEWKPKIEKYNKRLAQYNARKRAVEEVYQKNLAWSKKSIKEAGKKISEIEEEMLGLDPKVGLINDNKEEKKLKNYWGKKEVLLEGVGDLLTTHVVTEKNIFASIWTLKGAVDKKTFPVVSADDLVLGKKPDEAGQKEEMVHNLAALIAATQVQNSILEATRNNPRYAEGQQCQMMLASLNNGDREKAIRENPVFDNMVQEAIKKGQPINADHFVKRYIEMSEKAERDPQYKIKAVRKQLINDFGKKPVTKDCLQDIIRLAKLDMTLKELPNQGDQESYASRALTEYYSPVTNPVYNEKGVRSNHGLAADPLMEEAITRVIEREEKHAEDMDRAIKMLDSKASLYDELKMNEKNEEGQIVYKEANYREFAIANIQKTYRDEHTYTLTGMKKLLSEEYQAIKDEQEVKKDQEAKEREAREEAERQNKIKEIVNRNKPGASKKEDPQIGQKSKGMGPIGMN